MNHISTKIKNFSEFITESLGIDKSIESQAQSIYQEVKNSDKNEFDFVLYETPSLGQTASNHPFKLFIGDTGDAEGYFTVHKVDKSLSIKLKNRNDYSTLLHELKHLSRAIKNKGKHFNHYIFKSREAIDNMSLKKNDPLYKENRIFYVYDIDEFEAKYHGYYVNIDEYIQEHVRMSKKLSPDKKIDKEHIILLCKKCLEESKDLSYTWWIGWLSDTKTDKEFKFSNYLKEKDINRLFYLISKNDFNPGCSFIDIFKDVYLDLKKMIKTKFNIYSKKDKILIQRKRKIFEAEINKRKRKFSKRFYRLFSIMVSKYADS